MSNDWMDFFTIYKNWVYRKPSANMSHFIGVDDIQVISFLPNTNEDDIEHFCSAFLPIITIP